MHKTVITKIASTCCTASLAILIGACAGNQTMTRPTASPAMPAKHFPGKTSLATQHISGQITENDGLTPVENATIYIPNRMPATGRMLGNLSLESAQTENGCMAPQEPHFSYTCTRVDGSFELPVANIDQLPMPLVMSKGETKSEITLTLNDLGTDIGQLAFNLAEDTVEETVAVVLDFFNPYGDISTKFLNSKLDPKAAYLVISEQLSKVLDMENPSQHVEFPSFASLFKDSDGDEKADLYNYTSIYINSRDADDVTNMDKKQKKQLLRYIATGGQLYVTEWTIEQEEVPLDQFI